MGQLVKWVDSRNKGLQSVNLLGISIDKYFMPSVANVIGTDLSSYKVVSVDQFACNPMHVGRDEKMPVALYMQEDPSIVSPAYFVFEVIDSNEILPEYLMLWFRRKEFDREVWFHTDGSVRGGILWEELCELTVPVPSIAEQQEIVDAYNDIERRIALKRKINDNLEEQAYNIFKSVVAHPLDNFVSCKMLSLPVEITDFVANGSFASLNKNVTLYDEPNFAYYVRNTDLKSNTYTKFVDEPSYNFLTKSALNGGEVIISNVADVGSVYLCPVLNKPMTLGSNIIMLKSNNNLWSFFLYLYFKYSKGKEQIVEITTGSAQPKFNKTAFRNLDLLVPNHALLMSFNSKVSPMFAIIEQNNGELRMLNELELSFLQSISRR